MNLSFKKDFDVAEILHFLDGETLDIITRDFPKFQADVVFSFTNHEILEVSDLMDADDAGFFVSELAKALFKANRLDENRKCIESIFDAFGAYTNSPEAFDKATEVMTEHYTDMEESRADAEHEERMLSRFDDC